MNTVADNTRTHRTSMTASPRVASSRSLRASARRIAGWWTADPMSVSFCAARERDERLLQRVSR